MPDEVIVKVFAIDEILRKIIKLCGTGFERIATLKSVNQVTNKKAETNKKNRRCVGDGNILQRTLVCGM